MRDANIRREQVLARVRLGLGTYASEQRVDGVKKRIAAPPAPLVPERAQRDAAGQAALLKSYLEGQAATLIDVAAMGDVPAAVAGYLRQTNLPMRVRTGEDSVLSGLDWSGVPTLERMTGRAIRSDEVGLSRATCAVAETGTLVLASGPDNPVTVTFLPETHIVVVEKGNVVGGFEGVWARLRARFGRGGMSRTVNFVSGPSRTADIGGQLVMGAHGPRRLCVILVG